MQVVNGQLTILNAHTLQPKVFWNGQMVSGIKSIRITNDGDTSRVALTMIEDAFAVEMKAAGIIIKREAV